MEQTLLEATKAARGRTRCGQICTRGHGLNTDLPTWQVFMMFHRRNGEPLIVPMTQFIPLEKTIQYLNQLDA